MAAVGGTQTTKLLPHNFMAFFKQEAVYQGAATYLPNGHKLTLDFVSAGLDGYIATEVGYVINQIRSAISQRIGGWVEVTEAEYLAELKKKASPQPAQRGFRSLNAGMFQPQRGSSADEAAAVVAAIAAKPDPITPPTPEQMRLPARPRVGKMVKA
jgi:hypothetical protein